MVYSLKLWSGLVRALLQDCEVQDSVMGEKWEPFASYSNPALLQALLPISGAPGMFSLSTSVSSLHRSSLIARVSCSPQLTLLSCCLLSPINHFFLFCPIPSLFVLGTVFSCYIHGISHWIHSTLSFSLVEKCEVC